MSISQKSVSSHKYESKINFCTTAVPLICFVLLIVIQNGYILAATTLMVIHREKWSNFTFTQKYNHELNAYLDICILTLLCVCHVFASCLGLYCFFKPEHFFTYACAWLMSAVGLLGCLVETLLFRDLAFHSETSQHETVQLEKIIVILIAAQIATSATIFVLVLALVCSKLKKKRQNILLAKAISTSSRRPRTSQRHPAPFNTYDGSRERSLSGSSHKKSPRRMSTFETSYTLPLRDRPSLPHYCRPSPFAPAIMPLTDVTATLTANSPDPMARTVL